MNRILYKNRCRCNEEFSITKKRKLKNRSEGKPLPYPKSIEITSKTFQLKYSKNLSLTAKFILNSFQNKYIYYAIDDILYLLNSSKIERDSLLAVLYSPILSLQNNFSINFFDIWINEIYIDKIFKDNRFLKKEYQIFNKDNFIIIKFFYKTKIPVKKKELLW